MTTRRRRLLAPQAHRRRLRAELRRARIEAGLTQPEVARVMGWSTSKVVRIETGATGISPNDLRPLLGLYGVVDEQQIAELLAASRESSRPAWWSKYREVLTPRFSTYLEYESSATAIRQFQALVIPGLLQTEPYMRALLGSGREPGDVELAVAARLRRQQVLTGDDRPRLHVILDEAALRRPVGGPDIMLDQLRQLREFCSRPGTRIQILPFDIGAHPGLNGPFVLLEVDEEPVLYLENSSGELLDRDDPEQIEVFLDLFRQLERMATRNDAAIQIIDDAIAALGT